jgi:hypothetical protein
MHKREVEGPDLGLVGQKAGLVSKGGGRPWFDP